MMDLGQMNFELPRESLYEIIADRLEEQMAGGHLEKLPSEQSLAASFNVSRPVIREALKLLKARGLIEQKRGGATMVCMPDMDYMQDVMTRFIRLQQLDIREVYQARLCIEPYSARLAARKVSASDISELNTIYEEMIRNQNNTEERIRLDARFHLRIAEMSGNSILAALLHALTTFTLRQMRLHVEQAEATLEERIFFHKQIIDALEAGNGEYAETLNRLHLIRSMNSMNLKCEEDEE